LTQELHLTLDTARGPPRRYYQLTDSGKRALADFSEEWPGSGTPSTRW
jgi:DNA-binding PadR family transcriptional regulator